MGNLFNTIYFKLFKNSNMKDNDWLDYYSEEDRTIKFTNLSIYDYLYECGKDYLSYYALNYFNTRITYGELFKKIDIVSKALLSLGVKRGDVVTICMPNTPEAIYTFYAANKIGAIADMVHPLSSSSEVKNYLDNSKSRILILHDANYDKFKDMIPKTLVYKTIITSVKESMPTSIMIGYELTRGFKIKKYPKKDKDYISWKEFYQLGLSYKKSISVHMKKKEAALILHSGGTTGTPKGILISNYSFNALAQQGSINVKNVRPKDKIVTILPIFHGFGLGVTLHCPLTLKVEAILMPEYDSKRFYNIVKTYKPEVVAGVPTLWESIMSSNEFKYSDFSSFKYIISGGDHLSIEMENEFNKFLKEHGASIRVSKGYGMTESVAATAYTFENVNIKGSIGIPMIGNKFKIVKPGTIDEVELGCEGEICVLGPTLMIGYLNNKEETDKVLIKHSDGNIWLHTGDAGYISKEGIIYFTQRLKRVIVSSGFNLYPSQIEEAILKHPKVKSVCVIGVKHPYKMHVAKAYIVLKDNIEASAIIRAEIKLLCKKHLAAYSQPKYFEYRDSLPKTLYNKIDYKKLEMENIDNE